jgi:glyoxylase-like metal-dependent hydrolase (beta-lactamase superfamily II)
MLDAMADAEPAAGHIDTVVNTHANGDHCYGNQLVRDAEIIASQASAEEMDLLPPAAMAEFVARAKALGPAGEYFERAFGAFDFDGIEHTPPTKTFSRELSISVGNRRVDLIEVGPAHTRGGVIVHLPDDGVVFTGDILFINGTPILWEGPLENWLRACDRILEMNPTVIVPGHGPLTDADGVRGVRSYLAFVRDEARIRFDAGLSAADAARDIALGDYASWGDSERIAINVHTLYREFGENAEPAGPMELFALMAEIERARAR